VYASDIKLVPLPVPDRLHRERLDTRSQLGPLVDSVDPALKTRRRPLIHRMGRDAGLENLQKCHRPRRGPWRNPPELVEGPARGGPPPVRCLPLSASRLQAANPAAQRAGRALSQPRGPRDALESLGEPRLDSRRPSVPFDLEEAEHDRAYGHIRRGWRCPADYEITAQTTREDGHRAAGDPGAGDPALRDGRRR
jgi:hypothetical protein